MLKRFWEVEHNIEQPQFSEEEKTFFGDSKTKCRRKIRRHIAREKRQTSQLGRIS